MAREYDKRIFRILSIITLLESSHRRWQAGDLADHFGISERTFHRDRSIMEQAGIPLYYDQQKGSYCLTENFNFNPPKLEEKEALALILVARSFDMVNFPYFRELNRALAKLISALPSYIENVINRLLDNIILDPGMDVNLSSHLETIRLIESGIEQEKIVEIDYYSLSSDRQQKRKIAPYGLVYREGAGYVVGLCYLRKEERMFRIDRIRNIELLGENYVLPDDFSLEEYFAESWGVEQGEKQQIEVVFSGFAARFVSEGDWHDSQKVEKLSKEKIKFTVETGSLQEMKRWVLSFGSEAEVRAPRKLKEEIKQEINEMKKKYD